MSTTHIILILAIGMVMFGGANYYVARRVYQCIRFIFPKIRPGIYTATAVIFALVMILGFIRGLVPVPYGIKRIWGIISAYWIGLFIYLLLFFILTDVVLLAGSLFKVIPNPMPGSIRFISGLLVILLAMGTVGYGVYHANQIKCKSYDIQLEANESASGLKIVLISDLHLGAVFSEERIENTVQEINRSEPDLVCIAGDIFDNDYYAINNAVAASDTLKKIRAKYGVYACLGNHDSGETFDEMLKFLERSNIKLLSDEYVTVDNRMILVGRLDSSPIGGSGDMKRRNIEEVMAGTDTNLPVVVMDHNPENIDEYGSNISLVLSGHTHKGQIFPGNLFTRLIYGERDYGYSKKDSNSPHVVVTSGAGAWGIPMRVGTDCEIVSILLH